MLLYTSEMESSKTCLASRILESRPADHVLGFQVLGLGLGLPFLGLGLGLPILGLGRCP